GRDEESLRDRFVTTLSSHFQNTTAETFNKTGKTDILVRHEGETVFVAECKIWRGSKAFHEAIDQLLGYLTWREQDAAIILFVPNRDISAVLRTIEEEAAKHACFVGPVEQQRQGWYSSRF